MQALTKKQERFLHFLREHMLHHGAFPTYAQIKDYFDFKSNYSVLGYLEALEKKDALYRANGHWQIRLDNQTWRRSQPNTLVITAGFYWIVTADDLSIEYFAKGSKFAFEGWYQGPVIPPESPVKE